jgi:hypothetical protein
MAQRRQPRSACRKCVQSEAVCPRQCFWRELEPRLRARQLAARKLRALLMREARERVKTRGPLSHTERDSSQARRAALSTQGCHTRADTAGEGQEQRRARAGCRCERASSELASRLSRSSARQGQRAHAGTPSRHCDTHCARGGSGVRASHGHGSGDGAGRSAHGRAEGASERHGGLSV